MKILITGAKGFIGKNLCHELRNAQFEVLAIDVGDDDVTLQKNVELADFVVHLAGVNRPLSKEEFYQGNTDFTVKLCDMLQEKNKQIPIIFSSSIQASKENDYGCSKKKAEDYLHEFGKSTNSPVYIYRLSNVFGKWCRPNYNSVVATFCYNTTHNQPIIVNDENVEISFVYIDDVIKDFLDVIRGYIKIADETEFLEVKPIYTVTLKTLVELLQKFKSSRETFIIPDMSGGFETKLYATYLSYLDPKDCAYELKMNVDNRGSFTEFIRTKEAGQFSINVALPGITKGNHWHHTKNEKFLVVSGKGLIKLRKVDNDQIYKYFVDGDKLVVIDIPVGYTHSIANIGNTQLVTVMWASEPFNKDKPDTYYMEV